MPFKSSAADEPGRLMEFPSGIRHEITWRQSRLRE